MIGTRARALVSTLGAMVLAVVVTATCSTSQPSTPTMPPPPGTSGDPTATPDVSPAGVVAVTCADGHAFASNLLFAPGQAQLDPDPAAQALRDYLATDRGTGDGVAAWVRVAQTADRVQFVGRKGDGGPWVVVGFFVHEGAWTLDVAGECQAQVVLPGGVGPAEWRLDPASPKPAAADRTIHVLINERACASGQSPDGRVLPPIIVPSATAMTITITIRNRPGNQDCPGNPDFAIAIELPEPLGGRKLLDGAVFPPRDVSQALPAG